MNKPRGEKVENKNVSHLHDELVVDILSRLPAKDMLRCRRVCPLWRDLTSGRNQFFADLHRKNCVPMILTVDRKIKGRKDSFFLDKWWESGQKSSELHRFAGNNRKLFSEYCLTPGSCILFSLNGLIVSHHISNDVDSKKIIVFNPLNGENVIITLSINTPSNIHLSDTYGVYFHPILKEYCALLKTSSNSWGNHDGLSYRVLNLGSKPCWKKIRNPTCKDARIRNIAPVFIDKYLYCAVRVGQVNKFSNRLMDTVVMIRLHVMEFDIISEKFKMMPCPVPIAFMGFDECNINLLNIDGCLAMVQIMRCGNLADDINIWTLKDRLGQLWEFSNYRFNLDVYPSYLQLNTGFPKAICVVNGEVAVQLGTTLLVYNLKRRTIRIMGKKKYRCNVHFFSHLMSFASLRNCKSNLYMDENGEVPMSHCPRDKEFSTSTSGRKAIGDAYAGKEGIIEADESSSRYESH